MRTSWCFNKKCCSNIMLCMGYHILEYRNTMLHMILKSFWMATKGIIGLVWGINNSYTSQAKPSLKVMGFLRQHQRLIFFKTPAWQTCCSLLAPLGSSNCLLAFGILCGADTVAVFACFDFFDFSWRIWFILGFYPVVACCCSMARPFARHRPPQSARPAGPKARRGQIPV